MLRTATTTLSRSTHTPSTSLALHRLLATSSSPLRPLSSSALIARQTSPPAFFYAWTAQSALPLARRAYSTAPVNASPSSPSSSSHSSHQTPPPPPQDPDAKLPLTLRVKALFRKHGWTALVLYLVLSALDFGLTFFVISAVGADRVREAEDWVLDKLGWKRKGEDEEPGRLRRVVEGWKKRAKKVEGKEVVGTEQKEMVGGGEAHEPIEASVVTPEQRKKQESGYSAYATTAVLAYAIHKTALLPFRVGVTVAITPKVVRLLQSWGWKVGYAGTTAATGAAAASAAVTKEATP
ncbi:hypothetical protein JCM8547_004686 [Rhodosporidiobolus lusitaniae]